MNIEKYITEEGTVACLYSPEYGAGWSSWARGTRYLSEFLVFDKTLVRMALENKSESDVKKYIEQKHKEFPDEGFNNIYTGGWPQIRVEYLERGSHFYIVSVDGFERVEYFFKDIPFRA